MDQVLWKKILDFDLDGPVSEYPFWVRLSLENGWTKSVTQNAVVEYKKFMYLAATSREMVSPSGIVDLVWHEHLIFTKSYSEFCDLIGKRIEHFPATGQAGETAKFEHAKRHTATAYESCFGKQPKSYWEFGNMTDQLELPKAPVSIDRFALYGMLAFFALLIPMYFVLLPIYSQLSNYVFFVTSTVLFLVSVIGLQVFNKRKLASFFEQLHRKSYLFELSPIELIYAKTGSLAQVIHSSVSRLVREDRLLIDGEHISLGRNDSDTLNPITFTIVNSVRNHGGINYHSLVRLLLAKPALKTVAASIDATSRYFRKSRFMYRLFAVNFLLLATLFLFISVRLLTGLTRGKPVFLLIFFMIVAAVAIIWALWELGNAPIRSHLVSHHLREHKNDRNAKLDYDLRYFLFGQSALLPAFLPVYRQSDTNSGNSSASCSSSCGSSCGGGGCGGCGGGS